MTAAQTLVVSAGGATRRFNSDELLARHDAVTVAVSNDPAYGGAVSYRAVPLRALLAVLPPDRGDTIQARATDGFVAEIPRTLIDGMAMPWIAIEDPAHPWPQLRGKAVCAGPFYLIWQGSGARTRISPEQWAYALAALTVMPSPAQRWPAIAVDTSVPGGAPARRGQPPFITNCLPCHRLGGAGEGTIGPEPMPATKYFTETGLRALIRNPAAVRSWPGLQMPALDAATLEDTEVEAIIAYLQYLGERSK